MIVGKRVYRYPPKEQLNGFETNIQKREIAMTMGTATITRPILGRLDSMKLLVLGLPRSPPQNPKIQSSKRIGCEWA